LVWPMPDQFQTISFTGSGIDGPRLGGRDAMRKKWDII